jgi:hypothetical protein
MWTWTKIQKAPDAGDRTGQHPSKLGNMPTIQALAYRQTQNSLMAASQHGDLPYSTPKRPDTPGLSRGPQTDEMETISITQYTRTGAGLPR